MSLTSTITVSMPAESTVIYMLSVTVTSTATLSALLQEIHTRERTPRITSTKCFT